MQSLRLTFNTPEAMGQIRGQSHGSHHKCLIGRHFRFDVQYTLKSQRFLLLLKTTETSVYFIRFFKIYFNLVITVSRKDVTDNLIEHYFLLQLLYSTLHKADCKEICRFYGFFSRGYL